MGELRKIAKSQKSIDIPMENIGIDKGLETPPYNPEFVDKILKGREDIKNGKGLKIDIDNLWD